MASKPKLNRNSLARWAVVAAISLPVLAIVFYDREDDDHDGAPANGAAPRRFFNASGYSRIVNDLFVRHFWLDVVDNAAGPEIKLSAAGQKHEAIQQFHDRSFLRRDIQSFNNGDRDIFEVINGSVGYLDPTRHSIRLPFAREKGWHGNILTRPLPMHLPTLRNEDGGTLAFLPLKAPAGGELVKAPMENPFARIVQHRNHAGLRFAASQDIGYAHRIGDDIVFRAANNPPGAIQVDGQRLGGNDLAVIKPGAVLRFDQPGAPYALYWRNDGDIGNALSIYQMLGQRDRPNARLADYAQSLESSMDRAVSATRSDVVRDMDLKLSLDPVLDSQLQPLFEGQCDRAAKVIGRDDFAGAALIMDALSGEVLASASYPADVSNMDHDRAKRLSRNQNLVRLDIGSIAKVLFAASIIDTWPEMTTLQIAGGGGGKFDSILGASFASPLEDHGMPAQIDFATFIAKSSNRYAAALALLAARDPSQRGAQVSYPLPSAQKSPEAQYSLNGISQKTLPPDIIFKLAAQNGRPEYQIKPIAGGLSPLLPWVPRLGEMFDVDYEEVKAISQKTPGVNDLPRQRQRLQGDDVLDASPWQDALLRIDDAAQGAIPDPQRFFRPQSPDRINIAANKVRAFREDYLPLFLGGGNSRWTTVKVAEAFSRIVTNKKVEATFLYRQPPQAFADLKMNQGARKALLGGMSKVAAAGGTAKVLRPEVEALAAAGAKHGKLIAVYSKTGTPQIEEAGAPTAVAKAIDKLTSRKIVTLSGNLLVYRGQSFADSHTLMQMMMADSNRPIPRQMVADVAEQLAEFNADPIAGRQEIIAVHHGNILGAAKERKSIKRFGKAFAFVVARYPESARQGTQWDLSVAPEKALTVVINVQAWKEHSGGGDGPALLLAKQLLAGPLKQVMLDDLNGRAAP